MPDPTAVLCLDTASPVVSVAIGGGGRVLAERTIELRRSSERLLKVIEEVLQAAGLERREVSGVVALQGPGSFTGLRVGLATALGLHQALAIRATALPTLPILAAAAGPGPDPLLAVVDAIRGQWMTQEFSPGKPATARSERELQHPAELLARAPARIIGFGVSGLATERGWREAGIELIEPPPLAPVAARQASALAIDWDPSRLTAPIYFRPPAVSLPRGASPAEGALPTAAAGAMIQKSR